jgi:16S rRNA (cytosine967-C5)-methyltransferase
VTKAGGGGFKDMIFDNQLRHAVSIVETYKGETPLHVWLKDFFRANKQMGSRDRKHLSTLVYSFYRLGHSARHLSIKDRIITGTFLCTSQPTQWLAHFNQAFNDAVTQPLAEKLAKTDIHVPDIFPWQDQLSPAIDHEAFCRSFLRQPDLFLRIRPGYEEAVRTKLGELAEFIPPATIRLPNRFKVEDHFTPDKDVVVQDYSSQRIAEFLVGPETPHTFWDACAASGGKSILAHDCYPAMDLTVSDIRESILANLRARFQVAGIKKYHPFLADLTRDDIVNLPIAQLVLADVPCTGSGTWGRTPEDLFFFDPRKINNYQITQRKILTNIATHLAPGATLVYSTCSVFKKENEEMIAFLGQNFHLQPQHTGNLVGYSRHADTLFASRLSKS